MAFFEQLGKRLSDAGQNVAQQTKNLADVSQLNSENGEKEKQIKRLIFELGKAYYESHKRDFDAENVEIIGEINTLYREIHDNHEKIKQIKGIVKCDNCGADVEKTPDEPDEPEEQSFFARIWNGIASFFQRLFGKKK